VYNIKRRAIVGIDSHRDMMLPAYLHDSTVLGISTTLDDTVLRVGTAHDSAVLRVSASLNGAVLGVSAAG
jgi:hypothetical protein